MPKPSKEDIEREKRVEIARRKRRNMWRELKQKSEESRQRLVSSARDREIEIQKSVERVEHHLRKLNIDWVEIRSHSLHPLNSGQRKERIRSARLKKVNLTTTITHHDPKVRRRSTLQMKTAAAEDISDEALRLLQRNIVVDIHVVLSSFSLSLLNIVTCRFVNLDSSVRRRAFDTKVSATLDGVYVDDHIRSKDSKAFLLRGEAIETTPFSDGEIPDSDDDDDNDDDKLKQKESYDKFASLNVYMVEILSPDFPTARADMSVEYNSGNLAWEIDRETVANVLRFLSQGLREIDVEKARQGQKRLASRVTVSASKQIDLTSGDDTIKTLSEEEEEESKLPPGVVEKKKDEYEDGFHEHTKFDLRLSLDQCEISLLRFDSKELCKMQISSLGLTCTQQNSSMSVDMKFDSLRLLEEQASDILYVVVFFVLVVCFCFCFFAERSLLSLTQYPHPSIQTQVHTKNRIDI
jgi:hypothetical protein